MCQNYSRVFLPQGEIDRNGGGGVHGSDWANLPKNNAE
jgi:hypothetical protein